MPQDVAPTSFSSLLVNDGTPLVGVVEDKRTSGIYSLKQEGARPQIPATIKAACEAAWTCDAHLTCYFPAGPEGLVEHSQGWPRINKMGSTVISEMQAYGCDLLTQVFAFDFDLPKHRAWIDQQDVMRVFEELERIGAEDQRIGEWAYFYTTRGGARIIYILDKPMQVGDAESAHRWMVSRFRDLSDVFSEGNLVEEKTKRPIGGIAYDCSDWTRLFRLPRVLRDSNRTEKAPLFADVARWDVRLKAEALGRKDSSKGASVSLEAVRGSLGESTMPDDQQAYALREQVNDRGMLVATDFFRRAKARLRGRECFPCIFESQPMTAPGQGNRDNTMFRMVGQAAALLVGGCGDTLVRPEHLYALFNQAVQEFEPDPQSNMTWEERLWSACTRLWEVEEAKRLAFLERKKADERDEVDKMASMIQSMSEWCEGLKQFDLETAEGLQDAIEWVRARAIIVAKRDRYILQEDGRYSAIAKTDDELIPHIRRRGLEWLIPTKAFNVKTNQYADRTCRNIVDTHGIDVASVELRPTGRVSAITEPIRDGSDVLRLVLSPYARNSFIKPEFSRDVDQWLQILFGKSYEWMVTQWIPHALAFEEGSVCAVSIRAGEGVGKKLFVNGLAECLENPVTASAEDMTGTYQYGLLKSPFIVVDEGWPVSDRYAKNNVADVFRRLVTGGHMEANQRYSAPISMTIAPRVIITANNNSILDVFNSTKATTIDDQRALAVRLTHIEANDAAKDWLAARGGLDFTARPGSRWIRGEGNTKSDFVLAKHFLYLYSKRGKPTGRRMLVDGEGSFELVERMRMSTHQAQTMTAALVQSIEKMTTNAEGSMILPGGMAWKNETGELLVTANYVLQKVEDFSGQKIGRGDTRMRMREVLDHLPTLCLDGHTRGKKLSEMDDTLWYSIDLEIVYRYASSAGYPCAKLRTLLTAMQNVKKNLPLTRA